MGVDETIISSIEGLAKERDTEPYLIVVAGSSIGKLYHLDAAELVAGRSANCDLWIEDNTISRKHFCIKKKGNGYWIEDLNSTNGTYVNNKRIKTVELKAGDKIRISRETIVEFNFFDEDRKISEQKRYEMGVLDPVTGTYNKSFLLQRLSDEFSFSYRQNLPLSLLMIDLDDFKKINDKHGHLAGDAVLKEICAAIKKMIRTDDVFCRYGGEEFVIIMRNTECQHAVNLAERIRKKVEALIVPYENQLMRVTVSCGVSTLKDKNFPDYVALITDADAFLYKAKHEGRNQVQAVCCPE